MVKIILGMLLISYLVVSLTMSCEFDKRQDVTFKHIKSDRTMKKILIKYAEIAKIAFSLHLQITRARKKKKKMSVIHKVMLILKMKEKLKVNNQLLEKEEDAYINIEYYIDNLANSSLECAVDYSGIDDNTKKFKELNNSIYENHKRMIISLSTIEDLQKELYIKLEKMLK